MSQARFMIAAPASGSGKTLITCGLMHLLKRRGLRVQSFKCGPDFIDPMFHAYITGRPAGNLDAFMAEPDAIRRMLQDGMRDADITLTEGVMGFFDGIGFGDTKASSADAALRTGTPVILVMNGRGVSTSILPLIQGMLSFPGGEMIKGIILNRISKGVFPPMKQMIESALPVKVIGYLPELPDVRLDSRHLGLMMPSEIEDLEMQLNRLADCLEDTVSLEGLLTIAKEAEVLCEDETAAFTTAADCPEGFRVRIGVAKDEAFCFFYQENLRMLERAGAEPVYFSPLHDEHLPEDLDALLLVGGYPELKAQELSANKSMRTEIADACKGGMPVLAECGGFLYLHRTLEDLEGKAWPMCGVIHAAAYNNHRLTRFGYITLQGGMFFGQDIGHVRAHEFHHYDSEYPGNAFLAVKPAGKRRWNCIHSSETMYAGFPHLYYPANPEIVTAYIAAAQRYHRRKS